MSGHSARHSATRNTCVKVTLCRRPVCHIEMPCLPVNLMDVAHEDWYVRLLLYLIVLLAFLVGVTLAQIRIRLRLVRTVTAQAAATQATLKVGLSILARELRCAEICFDPETLEMGDAFMKWAAITSRRQATQRQAALIGKW